MLQLRFPQETRKITRQFDIQECRKEISHALTLSHVLTFNIQIENTVKLRRTYALRTTIARGAWKLHINKIPVYI